MKLEGDYQVFINNSKYNNFKVRNKSIMIELIKGEYFLEIR